jgi:hypothetical protein
MQPYATILSLALLLLGCRGPAARPIAAPDDGLGEALRTLVVKSLVGGGRRAGQLYVAADTASDTLLRAAGIPIVPRADAPRVACPGSTDAAGEPTAGEVGYLVHVRRTPQPSGALQLEVTVSCSYVFRGNVRPFAQGGTWELRRLGDRWHIVASLGEWIT